MAKQSTPAKGQSAAVHGVDPEAVGEKRLGRWGKGIIAGDVRSEDLCTLRKSYFI